MLITLLTVLPLILLAEGEGDDVAVVVTHVQETRTRQYVRSERRPVEEGKLELGLEIRGDAINAGSQISNIEITEATDDAQTDLTPDPEALDSLIDFRSRLSSFGHPDPEPEVLRMRLPLKLPKRTAKVIRGLKGKVTMSAGGEIKELIVKDILGKIGNRVEDETLKDSGLEIRIVDPRDVMPDRGKNEPISSKVGVEVRGNVSALRAVDVVDENGQSIAEGVGAFYIKDQTVMVVDLIHDLDDVSRLKIRYLSGAREVVVPFEATDLELP